MDNKLGIVVFALIEILIGLITFIAVLLSLIQGNSTKPSEVIIFVLTTAVISTILGFGILRYNLTSYRVLLFFSKTIILSKILIFARIITLNGTLETIIPSYIKNAISIIYHSLIIFYFTRKSIRKRFGERQNATFHLNIPFLK